MQVAALSDVLYRIVGIVIADTERANSVAALLPQFPERRRRIPCSIPDGELPGNSAEVDCDCATTRRTA
jgi:hypothetical protein